MSSIALVWLLIRKKGVENEFACAPFKVGQVDLERIISFFFFFTLVWQIVVNAAWRNGSQPSFSWSTTYTPFSPFGVINFFFFLHLFRSSNAWHSHIHLNINFLVLYEREEERKEVKTMKQSSFFIRIAILALHCPPSGTDFNLWPQSYCQEYSVLSTDT